MKRSILGRIKAALMPGLNLIASFFQQATAQGTRSTIMNPLGWFTAISIGGLLGAVHYQAPFEVLLLLGSLTGLSGIAYLGSYVFCLTTKREHLLRTEKFVLQQLAIEKGFRGDSTTGVVIHEQSTALVRGEKAQSGGEAE